MGHDTTREDTMSNPNDPDIQAGAIATERDKVRERAQRAAVERAPENLYRDLLRLFAAVAGHCDGMYDDVDGETHMPVEDSDQIASAGTEVARLLDCKDTWNATAHALRAAADKLAGRLRVLDLLLEADGSVVCASCNGHGVVYVEATGDEATCNDCRGNGHVYADEPAPNRWRNVEGDAWWRPDADCHVFRAGDAWWWALGSADTLRSGSAGTREEAMQDADDYIAGMWAERIQDPPDGAPQWAPQSMSEGMADAEGGDA